MISVENYFGGQWIDVSDFVASLNRIPIVSRNRDFTARIEAVKITVCEPLFNEIRDGERVSIDEKFRIKIDGVSKFFGYVTEAPFDYDTREQTLTIFENLGKLTEKKICHDVLSSALRAEAPSTASGFRAMSYFNGATVGVLHTIEMMFSLCGLGIVTSSIASKVVKKNHVFTFSITGHNPSRPTVTRDILMSELFFGEQILYNYGKSTAQYHSQMQEPTDKSFFDLVNEFCGCFGLYIQNIGENTYQFIELSENYTYDENEINDEIEITEMRANTALDAIGINETSIYPRKYLSPVERELSSYNLQKGVTESVTVTSNLGFFFEEIYQAAFTPSFKTITAVTKGEQTVQITTELPHGFTNDTKVVIKGVVGFFELCPDKGRTSGVDAVRVTSVQSINIFSIAYTSEKAERYIEGGWCFVAQQYGSELYTYDTLPANRDLSADGGSIVRFKLREKCENYTKTRFKTDMILEVKNCIENYVDVDETSSIIMENYNE